MKTNAAGMDINMEVDIPDGLEPKAMQCLCYPLACHNVTKPNSYQPVGPLKSRFSRLKVCIY